MKTHVFGANVQVIKEDCGAWNKYHVYDGRLYVTSTSNLKQAEKLASHIRKTGNWC